MSATKILIVDDEKNVRRSLALTLEDAGYEPSVAENALDAMARVRDQSFDLILVDIRMGEISGLQLFQKLREEGVQTPVLFMSGNASLSEAVETIRLGGSDFLEKPFAPERLLVAVARSLKIGALEKQLNELKEKTEGARGRHEMLGQTPAMRSLYKTIEKVAPTKSKVLIEGESGSGKELIARALHRASAVAGGPFVKVNCAAIPSELIESELFGHERGAFTGALQTKRGLFELAHGGTIFLDEIAEMSASAQAKVLRVVQSQEITRVGGSQVIRVDTRIIAATHKDLKSEVARGRFREDLYFRLNVVPLKAIPLRDRKDDISLMVDSFIRECCAENGFAPKAITPEALIALVDYSWPGNVRELRNVVERMVVLAGERILPSDLPDEITGRDANGSSNESAFSAGGLEQFKKRTERAFLIATLKRTNGNISRAAELLEIERTYLHRKIQDHSIQKSEYF